MKNVNTYVHSVLPYGMLFTTIFQHFRVNLDDEMDIRAYKHIDAIDNESITHMGYEEVNHKRVPKTSRAPVDDEDESEDEATMGIPPPSPIDALSLSY